MKLSFRANTISAKLTWMNLLVTGCALLLACLSFLAYDFFSYRESLIQNLFSVAQIAGTNSVTALMFDDPQAAQTTLSGLRNSPDVLDQLRIFIEHNVGKITAIIKDHIQRAIGATEE